MNKRQEEIYNHFNNGTEFNSKDVAKFAGISVSVACNNISKLIHYGKCKKVGRKAIHGGGREYVYIMLAD